MALVHLDAALLRRAVDAVGDEELVQQAGVVGIAQVLGVELPVAGDELARVAEDADRPVEEALDDACAELAEVLLERLGLFGLEGAEEHASAVAYLHFPRGDRFHFEILGHTAFALQALAEG